MTWLEGIPTWILHVVRIVLALCSFALMLIAAQCYKSEQRLVLAEGGRKTVTAYENLLRESVQANPWNGDATLRLADYYFLRKEYDRTLKLLKQSSPGRHHWRGWERMGAVYERIGYGPLGTDDDVAHAAMFYDQVLTVYPSYQLGLERRAVLALKRGDWISVANLASDLQRLDANNRNSIYMRARSAEALGQMEVATQLYSQLSATGKETTSSLFTSEEVLKRLKDLEGFSH